MPSHTRTGIRLSSNDAPSDITLMKSPIIPAALAALCLSFGISDVRSEEEKISLWPGGAPAGDGTTEQAEVPVTIHRPPADKANGTAMVICPGGGYGMLVREPEGHKIARWLNEYGITGFVLEYRLPKGRAFVPLLDAQRTIRTVRANAAKWGVRPDRIGIIGFSAGGHLATTAVTHFDDGNPKADDPVEKTSSRPDFGILVYPVVSMGDLAHKGSRNNLLGNNPSPELVRNFSNETQVTAKTPPVFLVHALDDKVVDPANSRGLYEALVAKKIPAKYLELPSGGHGLNGYKGPMWDAWQKESLAWLAGLKLTAP